MRKVILLSLVLFFAVFSFCSAQEKDLQFRLVVPAEDAGEVPHDVYMFQVSKHNELEELLVSKEVLLSKDDVDEIIITKKENTQMGWGPVTVLYFKPEAAAKLKTITTENIKKRFDAEGISIPYPQQDVHLYEHRE